MKTLNKQNNEARNRLTKQEKKEAKKLRNLRKDKQKWIIA